MQMVSNLLIISLIFYLNVGCNELYVYLYFYFSICLNHRKREMRELKKSGMRD